MAENPDFTVLSPEVTQSLTPMMVQFFEIKSVNPGYLLFYRMGDFYELFFEDAEIASAALGITLTKRGKHQGLDIPMCGVPVHAAQDYLKKLISLGNRVAICEQMEDPSEAKKRGAKSVVRRDVVRLVTPGTITEDDLLPNSSNNFLASLCMFRHGDADFALAWTDISTGDLFVTDITAESLGDELGRIDPAEYLITSAGLEEMRREKRLSESLLLRATTIPAEQYDSEMGSQILLESFPDDVTDTSIFSRAARAALGSLIAYVKETQKGVALSLRAPKIDLANSHMRIDLATRNSLELLATNRGEARGSLRHTIDMTVTQAGARLLTSRLAAPLVVPQQINQRLDMVSFLIDDTMLNYSVRTALKAVPDMARALTRILLERGGPRDLAAIGKGISQAIMLGDELSRVNLMPDGLLQVQNTLQSAPAALSQLLQNALDDELPMLARDGGFIRSNFHDELNVQRRLGRESRQVIAELQARLIDETDVKSLKIKHNNVLGYFVEVPASHGGKLLEEPFKAHFIHRQTLANAMRFTTTELAELEGRIARAQDIAKEIELQIFADLIVETTQHSSQIQTLADALAELDVTSSLALLAGERGYCRPTIDDSSAFEISDGRHPVVEQNLAKHGASFVANDCDLSGAQERRGQLWLITGPNMGGKSTYLRQNALIAIMAQMGSFVPATSAHIGVVDRVFSRVGASDDIAQGRSTFMVEMVETAAILDRATQNSLVILDEIGRGTSTFDGLSIAWACVEALHETTGCRALFATHYHELTVLSQTLPRVSNHTMKVREHKGDVVFLHEVGEGAADRSYGIQVAKLAGLPSPVIARAKQVLERLEKGGQGQKTTVLEELPLFAHVQEVEQVPENPVVTMLDTVRPDDLTPREALEWVYALKNLHKSNVDA